MIDTAADVYAEVETARAATRWTAMAWLAAAVMTLIVSISVLRIPVQVTDSLIVLMQAQSAPSAWIGHFVNEQGFLRPVYGSQTRLLMDVAGSHYYAVFRGFHVALVAALFALFVIVARVRTRAEWSAFAFALLVLAGHHTFRGNVWEAYPINHYLEVAVCSLCALALARSPGGWWSDVLAVLAFLFAALTLESGLLVWVVLVAARLTGLRGVSRAGLAAVTALVIGYFYVRGAYLDTGLPGLDERSVGFGFSRLERGEVVARFSEHPYLLYAYNVVASMLSIILSEPRSGTFEVTRRWVHGNVTPSVVVAMVSSAVASGLLVWYSATRAREWLARRFDANDRLVLVFGAVLVANAAMSYAYTKDEVMSTAGAFYAVAVFAVARALLTRIGGVRNVVVVGMLTMMLAGASFAWAVRSAGLHYFMVYSAYYTRDEWIDVDAWLRDQNAVPASDEGKQLVRSLRADALERPVLHPYFLPRWAERWFDVQ